MKKIISSCQRRLASIGKKIWIPTFVGMTMFFVSPTMAAEQQPSHIFNITYDDAQDAIGKALSERHSAESAEPKTIAAVINGKKIAPLYSSNKPINVEVRGLRADEATNRWSASMVILSDDNVVSALPLSGRYMQMSELPVLKKGLRSGEVIGENDIEMKSFPEERISKDTVASAAELIGRSPIRIISPSRPIRSAEISAPAIVKKNTLVQMRYKTANMEITTSGQALSDGAKGDVIEVRNINSKKVTHAVVAENGVVDVIAQGSQTSQIIPTSVRGEMIYAK